MSRTILILSSAFLVVASGINLHHTKSGTERRVVCYLGTWSAYRHGDGNYQIESTDVGLCTHLMYSFIGLDAYTFHAKSLDPNLDFMDNGGHGYFARAIKLKELNPDLKILVAVGGWGEGSYKYSEMATNAAKRRTFIDNVVAFVGSFGFDGLDVDWEYPGSRGGAATDKQYFVTLLTELREELTKHGWLLTVAVGMGPTHTVGYDVRAIAYTVDFVNLMTYDFRGYWDGKTGHHAQLFNGPDDTGIESYHNVNTSVHYWLNNGAPADKLNLGLPLYGKTFTVPAESNGPLGAPCSGAGIAGPYTLENGVLGYNEICEKFLEGGWTEDSNSYVVSPWAYKDDQWIAFDNVESIKAKSEWALSLGFGGGMVWSIETDDFRGKCGQGTFPLLRAVNQAWRGTEGGSVTGGPDGITTGTTTSQPTTLPTTTTTTTTTTQSSSGECVVGTLVPDTEVCSKYYQCAPSSGGSGEWMSTSCPSGLYFNEAIMTCDYQNNVDCQPQT